MKIKNYVALVTLLAGAALCGSCTKEAIDGDWAPIKITVNGVRHKSDVCEVPKEGGEYRFYSMNYGTMWLNEVDENATRVWPLDYDWSDYRKIDLRGEWYAVKYDADGNIVVSVQPMEQQGAARTLTLHVECGDAFDKITLQQQ